MRAAQASPGGEDDVSVDSDRIDIIHGVSATGWSLGWISLHLVAMGFKVIFIKKKESQIHRWPNPEVSSLKEKGMANSHG